MVGRMCSKPVVTAQPDDAVLAVARLMRARNVGAVVIVSDGNPVGLLTDRDLVVEVMARDRDPSATPVREVMRKQPTVIREDASVFDAARALARRRVRRLPVVNRDGRLVGIIALDDILMLLGGEMSNIAESLASSFVRTKS